MDCGLSRTWREQSAEDALFMRDEAGFRDDASIAESPSVESVGEAITATLPALEP